jgi:hypothetical protein
MSIHFIESKGQTGVEIVIMGAIVIVTILFMTVATHFGTKDAALHVTQIENNFDSSEATLLALLSDQDYYSMVGIFFSGYPRDQKAAYDPAMVQAQISSRLSMLAPSGCYVLSNGSAVVASDTYVSGACETTVSAAAQIVLPSGRVVWLTLNTSDDGEKSAPPDRTKNCCYSNFDPTQVQCVSPTACPLDWTIDSPTSTCADVSQCAKK